MDAAAIPTWQSLPEVAPGYRVSWQYFNTLPEKKEKDQLGTLNFLGPKQRLDASRDEILTGESISLELHLDHFGRDSSAFGGRPRPVHELKPVAPFAHEDHIQFNTQSTSQWDGLRHFGIRSKGLFYNGYIAADFENSDALGIHTWLDSGGIAGRGVLIDYKTWADFHGKRLEVNGGTQITLEDVKEVLKFQGTTLRPGDILIFRTGWLEWYNSTDSEATHKQLCLDVEPGEHHFIGLASEPSLVEWIWNNQIAAVAGDQPAFESTPPPSDYGWLHEHLLACLGCPIGELWNTERVAQMCHSKGRYSFFIASHPLALRGGVASVTNAMAIF